jgi:pectate lyase
MQQMKIGGAALLLAGVMACGGSSTNEAALADPTAPAGDPSAPAQGSGDEPPSDPGVAEPSSAPSAANAEAPIQGIAGLDGNEGEVTETIEAEPGPTAGPELTPPTSPTCEGPSGCALPAFPGADGAGGVVSGGRGGDVYHVTRLDTDFSDQTPGTLRFGLSNLTGPRTIVFDISGVFSLGRSAVAGWDDNGNGWDTASRLNIPSNVTIAGQTAPGPVIITGGVIKAGGENFILRNVTIAPGYGSRGFDEPERAPVVGDFPDSYVYDAIDITGHDLIIDHVTTVFATDETVSMNEAVTRATLQYSSISRGQNYPQADAEADGVRYTGHALGSLLQAGSNATISIHHNLYAHQKGRLPRVGTEADALTVPGVGAFNDLRNNVFYNWFDTAGTGASGQASQNNFIANFYLSGSGGDDPSGAASTDLTTKAGGTGVFDGNDPINTRVYHSGNLLDRNLDGDALDGAALLDTDFIESSLQASPFVEVPYAGVTDAADIAFSRVLDYVGSRYWERAPVDERLVAEVRAGTGQIIAWADDPFNPSADEGSEWRSLINTPSVAREAGFDTDQDGMPDGWEAEHGLDPALADNNGDFDADGYTNLEEYLNELAAWPASTAAQFRARGSQRYAQIQNWSLSAGARGARDGAALWQPSHHDLAQILTGTARLDAVGQHAGRLEVCSAHDMAALDVVAGWLDVSHELSIGAQTAANGARLGGAGQVNQSGGRVRVRRAVVIGAGAGATGEYNLTGGVLSAARLLAGGESAHFNFAGGMLHVDRVGFTLDNQGGVLWPGRLLRTERFADRAEPAFGYLRVDGDLRLTRGSLHLALGVAASDAVAVAGDVWLGGNLELEPVGGERPEPGASWTILTARGKVQGAFAAVPSGYRVEIAGQHVLLIHGSQRREHDGAASVALDAR